MNNITMTDYSLYYLFIAVLAAMSIMVSNISYAANDTSIQGPLRVNIQKSLETYKKVNTIDGKLYVFDAVQNKLLTLTSGMPRPGIVKDGGFYLTCADYIDQNGNKVDLDFMVKETDGKFITTQTIVHAISDKYRPYHLRDRNN